MNPFLVIVIIIFALVSDLFWFDKDLKRWGWMKNWSNKSKVLLLVGFIAVLGLIYLALSVKYI